MVVFFLAFHIARFSSKHFYLVLFLRSLSTQLFFLVASLFLVLRVTAFCYGDFNYYFFRDFAELFFQLSDCVLFSTFVGLLPVRVFPFFPFFYAPTEPASRAGCV